jgi:hypothetical protein
MCAIHALPCTSSYPKSGTTWTQNICYTLATKGERPLDHISHYAPFYEVDRTWDAAGLMPSTPAAAPSLRGGAFIFAPQDFHELRRDAVEYP